MGKLFYIMGKSASGKDSLYERLIQNGELNLKRIVLYTTRPIREGECDGQTYFFVDEARYQTFVHEGRIIEARAYNTVQGVWRYFTADDGQLDLENGNFLGIGTLESYERIREYLGSERVCPIYVEVEDGERLMRAISRERTQERSDYKEVCRRFLADCEDFSEERIVRAGIKRRFINDDFDDCLTRIESYIKSMVY